MSEIKEILQASNSWPIQCAKKIIKRVNNILPKKGYILFETGYGPSGLPHIGTFGEVVRTKFVQNSLEKISDLKTKLFVVSDDYDGLRKIPNNLPNKEMLYDNLDKPLTSIPDPFGMYSSFGEHMNSRLKNFLDSFNFEYEFKSATELYQTGAYDEYLLRALKNYDEIMKIMLPTLREERRKTYSPFLPICPTTGKILYVPAKPYDLNKGTIVYIDPISKEEVELQVTGGKCKLQWKPDFGVRWAALDVDFEMYGKDHLANGPIYSQICKVVGGKPPEQFVFELFLDKNGQKISKSKGNEEVTVDSWLKYAPTESLSLFMYQNPQRAKKLHFDVIPKSVDEYISYVQKYNQEKEEEKKYNNPAWFIHNGNVPKIQTYEISYSLLLNLAIACNPKDRSILWGFIEQYSKGAAPKTAPFLDKLVSYAINYYNDFIKNTKKYRIPTQMEVNILEDIRSKLVQNKNKYLSPEEIQNILYEIGRNTELQSMKEYFKIIYEILLGQSQGPRLGTFIALYGINPTIELIDEALNRRG